MWQLTSPVIQKATLGLSHSSQSQISTSQLLDGNLELINAVECVHWGESTLQVIVCKTCGITGCQPGNWVKIKRAGALALIIPAFARLDEAPEYLKNEYMPPHYLLEKGIIFIHQEYYNNTLCQMADFPSFHTLQPLFTWEAVKIFQLEAPYHVLGDLRTTPKLIEDIVMASSEGNFIEQVEHLTNLVDQLLYTEQSVRLRPVTEQDHVIIFYLDMAGIPEWKALSHDGSQYSLYLEPGYIVI